MTLRTRITLVAALAVGVAVVLASVVAYVAVRGELRAQVDRQLSDQVAVGQRVARRVEATGVPGSVLRELPPLPPELGGAPVVGQIVPSDGPVRPILGDELPITAADRAVAAGRSPEELRDAHEDGQHLRVLTAPLFDERALLVARPLDGVDHVLSRLRLLLALLCGSGVGLAALVGWIAADRVMAPIADLRDAARHVSETQDLGRRIDVRTEDEVGSSRRSSTRCSTPWTARSARSGSWSPMPRTSCARRSPACARTSSCWRRAWCRTRSGPSCWPTCASRSRS